MINKLLLSITVMLALLLTPACTYQRANVPGMTYAETLQHESVALVEETTQGARAYCTGVWIAQDEILTAGHCVEPDEREVPQSEMIGEKLDYVTYDDVGESDRYAGISVRHARVIAYTHDHDLALLRVDGTPPSHPVARISAREPRNGDTVGIVGMPFGYWFSYSTGVVAHTRLMQGPFDHPFRVLHIEGNVTYGNSGGGAFDSNGGIIGICSYGNFHGPGLSFFVHRDVIVKFLEGTHG